MDKQFTKRIDDFQASSTNKTLTGIKRGIEKESLRIGASSSQRGQLSQLPHPKALGSALTNPYITTDYSEALLELITPATSDPQAPLKTLRDIHRYIYQHLDDELLWVTSMPCVMGEDSGIPIARYGKSHSGQMKEIYRKGLGHRYGRFMQTIAGVHYNFSVPEQTWQLLYEQSKQAGEDCAKYDLQNFISCQYMAMIRNFLRVGWIIPYLFGASPAICASYLKGKKTYLDELVPGTLYAPYATSLRLGDLGYSNNAQASLNISYNCVDTYIEGLEHAIRTPEPLYEKIGVCVDGKYKQLNANLLQIENEYYSNIRPKRVTRSGERPTKALARGGVEYVEVRALDLNPFSDIGLDDKQCAFVDCLMMTCLFHSSDPITKREEAEIAENKRRVVEKGRHPRLRLVRQNRDISFVRWATGLFEQMLEVAKVLDASESSNRFSEAVMHYQSWIEDPEQTYSGQIIKTITDTKEGFFHLAMRWSEQHAQSLRSNPLDEKAYAHFKQTAEQSFKTQQEMEAKNSERSFEDFLAAYYA